MKLTTHILPRLEHILFASVFLGIAANGHRLLNFDGDLPRHLLMGKLIVQTRDILTVDVFSFRTTGFPAIPHEWLSQVILAGAYEWLGLNGVILLTASIMMLVWMVVFLETQSKSRSLLFSLIFTALAMGASQLHVLPRPHIFTYLLTGIWIALLERIDKKAPGEWWLLPAVMLVWVNLHGMFVLGILLWGIYLAGDFFDHPSRNWFTAGKTKSFAFGGVFSLVATLFSPSGIHIWQTIISLGSNSYITSKITEYQSANFHLPETWPFLALLLLTITGFARAKQVGWTHTLLASAFAFLALYTSRMIPLFAVVVAPVTAKAFADWMRNEHPQSRLAAFEQRITQTNSSVNGWIWIVLVVLGITLLFRQGISTGPDGKGNTFDGHFFPVQAVDWLESHPQSGRMFNEFDWGGYMLLRLWPRQQIFMDGHTHIYGEVLTREYETIVSLGDNWQGILERYQVEWVIVRTQAPIARELKRSGWDTIYQDETTLILRKP